jgi:hypothetical protein
MAIKLDQKVNWPYGVAHNWNCTQGQIWPKLRA